MCVANGGECKPACCSVLQRVAVLCIVLQYVYGRVVRCLCCSVLQCGGAGKTLCCSVLQCGAVCCDMLPCVAVSLLQCVAVRGCG